MKNKNEFFLIFQHEVTEILRARWFQIYIVALFTLMFLFYYFGLAESAALGFVGLGRLLLVFIQISILVLPLFVLITTARSLVGDREVGIWEYQLSLPVSLCYFFWAKGFGRFFALVTPIVCGILAAVGLAFFFHVPIPWTLTFSYIALIFANMAFFLGLAFFISVTSTSQEMAMALSFGLWLLLEGLIDALLLGMMLQHRILSETVLGLALFNPLQAMRMAALSLFDPDLTVLGPIAYTLLEKLKISGLLLWSVGYPALIGILLFFAAYKLFVNKDLV